MKRIVIKYLYLALVIIAMLIAMSSCTQTEHEHIWDDWSTIKEATCTEDGTMSRVCTVCGEKENKAVNKIAHNIVIDAFMAPTTTHTGLTEGKHCSICNIVLQAQEILPLLISSEGLEFTSNGDGTCYVSGIGTCTDSDIVIPTISPVGDTVTGIGKKDGAYSKGAFYNEIKIDSVIIPDTVTLIGAGAFCQCFGLSSITIPESVTYISESAFMHCYKLIEVCNMSEISTSKIERLFDSERHIITCQSDTYISTTEDGYIFYEDGENIYLLGYTGFEKVLALPSQSPTGKNYSIYMYAFYGRNDLAFVKIPAGVARIGMFAFSYCENLIYVEIPSSVSRIEVAAFQFCYKLIEVCNLSDLPITQGEFSTEYIGYSIDDYTGYYAEHILSDSKDTYLSTTTDGYIFYDDGTDAYLMGYVGDESALTLPDCSPTGQNYSIYQYAFNKLNDLVSVKVSEGVFSIGYLAFNYCESMVSIDIPSSVMNITNYAFNNCTSLTSVIIPASITSIGKGAFSNCTNLTSVKFANGILLMSIESNLFENCTSLTTLDLPEGITSICRGAFYNCVSLTSLILPASVTNIGEFAFDNCTGLTSMTIPENVTSIESGTFKNCTGLTSMIIPSNVTSIGYYAFENCLGLTSVIMPAGLTIIKFNAFNNCTGLTSLILPSCLTIIGDSAFENCNGLTSIIIPESVTIIGSCAFNNCTGLTSVCIPASVTYIGAFSFKDCISLASVKFEDGIKDMTIDYGAFSGCTSLSKFVVPVGVTNISRKVFDGCNNMIELIFDDTSSWYRTSDADDMENKKNGTQVDVTNSSTNANYFKLMYVNDCWYKLQ